MNILRQNTDYALRMMGNLARNNGENTISVRVLAQEEGVSYQYACKILQKLHEANLVESTMGPKGGYKLSRKPDQITMLDVVRAMQGRVAVNECTIDTGYCPRQKTCPVNGRLCTLQRVLDTYMKDVTLEDIQKRQQQSI